MKNLYAFSIALLLAFNALQSQDGTLDNTFGTSGFATTQFDNFSSEGATIARQTDGKIIIAGISAGNGGNLAVARYKTDGTLDNTFDTDGRAVHNFAGFSPLVTSVAVQSDGKILVGGSANTSAMLVRLTATGALDNTFGTNGFLEISDGFSKVNDFEVVTGGKIVGVGLATVGNNSVVGLFRRNANGAKDTGFGTSGYTFADAGNLEVGNKMVVQSDGKLVVTGTLSVPNTNNDLLMMRFSANGIADNTFGTAGKTITSFGTDGASDVGNDLLMQSDGKIIVVGRNSKNAVNAFFVARYLANGTLESTFGTSGRTVTKISNSNDEAKSVALLGNGDIVVGGFSATGANRKFAVVRYKSTGAIDNTFGTSGSGTFVVGTSASGEDIFINNDGKILIGGWSAAATGLRSFALARVRNTGTSGVAVISPAAISASVFPNPVQNQAVTLTFSLDEPQHCTARLFSGDGRLVETFFKEKLASGKQTELLGLPASLPGGVYYLKLELEKGVSTLPVEILR